MNIIEKLKEINEDDYFDPYYMIDEINNWPEVEDEDDGIEELDAENWKVTEVGEKHLTMKCGGDWQEPYEVKIKLNENNELEVVSYEPSDFEGEEVDMDELLGYEED